MLVFDPEPTSGTDTLSIMTEACQNDFWIIRRDDAPDGTALFDAALQSDQPAVAYRISDLARYLMNPKPIEVQKRLIGCEVHYIKNKGGRRREKIWQILPRRLGHPKPPSASPEVFIPHLDLPMPQMQDRGLASHLDQIYGHLKAYDPVYQGLTRLDHSQVADIVGICEDVDGNRSRLNLAGSVSEKADYVGSQMFQPVGVVLDNAYMSEGLFEMRGFDFASFNPASAHQMLKLTQNGQTKACVLNTDRTIAYWLKDLRLIRYMYLLEQSVQISANLKSGLLACVQGRAEPFKLFFKESAVTYSLEHLPPVYKEALASDHSGRQVRALVPDALNSMQVGVVFNYVSQSRPHARRLVTTLSVLHAVRALESLKEHAPRLYQRVKGNVPIAQAGKFYLLDAIQGYQDV